jgi:hypothetical protein
MRLLALVILVALLVFSISCKKEYNPDFDRSLVHEQGL